MIRWLVGFVRALWHHHTGPIVITDSDLMDAYDRLELLEMRLHQRE